MAHELSVKQFILRKSFSLFKISIQMPIVAAINSSVFIWKLVLIHFGKSYLHAISDVLQNPPIPWDDASVQIVQSGLVNEIRLRFIPTCDARDKKSFQS